MLHYEPEVGWVSWRSIWSLAQFSYSCIWARQRRTRSYTLFAPNDLITCAPGSRPPWPFRGNRRGSAPSVQSSPVQFFRPCRPARRDPWSQWPQLAVSGKPGTAKRAKKQVSRAHERRDEWKKGEERGAPKGLRHRHHVDDRLHLHLAHTQPGWYDSVRACALGDLLYSLCSTMGHLCVMRGKAYIRCRPHQFGPTLHHHPICSNQCVELWAFLGQNISMLFLLWLILPSAGQMNLNHLAPISRLYHP